VDFFTNFFHMIDLSFVSTTVFDLSKSEFVCPIFGSIKV